MASVASRSSAVLCILSFSKSNILGNDSANGSALTEYITSVKVCGLLCPLSPLTGRADDVGLAYAGFACSGMGASGGNHYLWSGAVGVLTWTTFSHCMVSSTCFWGSITLVSYSTA